MKSFSFYATLLALTGLAAGTAAADELSSRVVGRDGAIFTSRAATFGELFPGSTDYPATHGALILHKTSKDGSTFRLLVPGSDDAAVEEAASLAFDDEAGSVLMVWPVRVAAGASHLRYAAYDGSWSTVGTLKLAGAPAVFTAAPQIAVTRDAFPIKVGERNIIVAHRTVFNVAWRDAATGHARLSPIVFAKGMPIGWNEVVDLSAALATQVAPLAEPAEGLGYQTLSLRAEATRRSVVVTFGDAATGQIAEVEHRYRPMTLATVGPDVRNRIFRIADLYKPETMNAIDAGGQRPIVHLGSDGLGSDELTALAEGIRAEIIAQGSGTECGADGQYHGEMVRIGILSFDNLPGATNTGGLYLALVGFEEDDELTSTSSGILAEIIAIGRRATACDPGSGASLGEVVYVGSGGEILVVDPSGKPLAVDAASLAGDNGNSAAMSQTASLWLRASSMLPPQGSAPTWIFSGRATTHFLVAWLDGETVRYQMTTHGGNWSEIFQIPLTPELPLADALEVLAKRVR
jgi:hypothetical protein